MTEWLLATAGAELLLNETEGDKERLNTNEYESVVMEMYHMLF